MLCVQQIRLSWESVLSSFALEDVLCASGEFVNFIFDCKGPCNVNISYDESANYQKTPSGGDKYIPDDRSERLILFILLFVSAEYVSSFG